MEAVDHFIAGKDHLKHAETAQDPSRLLGLAQGHFMAAQTLILAMTYNKGYGMPADEYVEWQEAVDRQYGPDGKPVR